MNSLKPIVLPVTIIVVSIAVLLTIRKWSQEPSALILMQTEINRQHDQFTDLLQRNDQALFDAQRRLVSIEKRAAAAKDLLERTRDELIHTQAALSENEKALINTQNDLRQLQGGYRALIDASNAGAAEIANNPPPGVLEKRLTELTLVRGQVHETLKALAENQAYFARSWGDFSALIRNINDTHLLLRRANRDESDLPGVAVPSSLVKPDVSTRTEVKPDESDLVPEGSPSDRLAWVNERMTERSDELLGLQSELKSVMGLIRENIARVSLLQRNFLHLRELLDNNPKAEPASVK